jgi:hypothetical protein
MMMKMIPLEIQKESLPPRFESASLYSLLQYSVLAIGIAFSVASCDGSTTSDKYTIDEWNSDNLWWTQQLGTSSGDEARGVATDSSGNVFITGFTGGNLDGGTDRDGSDFFVVKYNRYGTREWTRQIGSGNTYDKAALCIATDSSGNVFVGGGVQGVLDNSTWGGTRNYAVVKYNSSGTKQWSHQGAAATDANGVATDSSGNVYVAAENYDNISVIKLNSTGAKQWMKQLDSGSTAGRDIPYAIATDSSDNVYVTGSTYGGLDGNTHSGAWDLFLVKYNSSGTKQWTKQLGSSEDDIAYGVAVDSSGNVYAAGYTYGALDGSNAGSNDLFVVKYNSSGTRQWTRQLGTSSDEKAYGVATDSSGNVYATGITAGALDGNTSAGDYDIFVVKYNSSGTKQWTRQLGSSKEDTAYGVAIDSPRGRVYIAGSTMGGLDGNTSYGQSDIFLTRMWTLDF